jgi:hypothetical protein
MGTLLIGVGRGRRGAGLARSRVAIFGGPGRLRVVHRANGDSADRSGDSPDSTASLKVVSIK